MPPSGDRIAQKWGFGMAPLKPQMEARYRAAVLQMKDFLYLQYFGSSKIDGAAVSEVKGLVNRCILQNQWDWFTVFSRFGIPDPMYLPIVSQLLPELRTAILSNDAGETERLHEQLNWTPLLTCCLNFLGGESSLKSDPGTAAGHIYVLETREHPHELKIGFTTRSIEERVREINSAAGVVFPFSVRRVFCVREAHRAEQRVFAALNQYRIRSDREFFKIDYATAVREIESCVLSEGLLHRSTGQIVSYSETRGYGFAATLGADKQTVFIHRSEVLREDIARLQPGVAVEFEACSGAKGFFALRVRMLSG